MKRTIQIKLPIECGDKTCAAEPSKFCRFFGGVRFGTVPVCLAFPREGSDGTWSFPELDVVDGWTQGCTACLDAEMRE